MGFEMMFIYILVSCHLCASCRGIYACIPVFLRVTCMDLHIILTPSLISENIGV